MAEGNGLDTFDHVVVLMLENRSFDNLLGYLYSQQYPVPPGKQFDGVDGKNLSNPIPREWQFKKSDISMTEVPVARINDKEINLTKCSPPYPDPGEDYPHVNTQLFNPSGALSYNHSPYNLPPVPPDNSPKEPNPTMSGFVSDYIQNYINNEFPPPCKPPSAEDFYKIYKYIMESYDPADVPVLSGLAREFAVFDHWFCSVPSETICNRNFWHAGTSWGHVINPGPGDDKHDDDNTQNTDSWLEDTVGNTLFFQLSSSNKSWKIYSDNRIPLSKTKNFWLPVTPVLHFPNFVVLAALEKLLKGVNVWETDILNTLETFKNDCANGSLPAYSFIEPNFFNPHNDMHPSTPDEVGDGPQPISPVLLGEALVWEVYNAIFTSPCWKNTLLIITFDEHGGCYDHVIPPGQYGNHVVAPAGIAAPPKLSGDQKNWDDFDFKRLGLRVPTIMVSAYINKNTIINEPMSHTSFLKTMHAKWPMPNSSLSAREDASCSFNVPGLFSSTPRTAMPSFPAPVIPPDDTDYSKAVMNALAKAIMAAIKELWCKAFPEDPICKTMEMKTQDDAAAFLRHAVPMAKTMVRPGDAAISQIKEDDWAALFQAIARELTKKKLL